MQTMELWLIGLSIVALTAAIPSPLRARQDLKYVPRAERSLLSLTISRRLTRGLYRDGQSRCTCEKLGDALVNPRLEELCAEAGGIVETNVLKSVIDIIEYFVCTPKPCDQKECLPTNATPLQKCVADSSAVRKTFTDVACASRYGKGYDAYCFDPVVCDPRIPPCTGIFSGVSYFCQGSKMFCDVSGFISAPAGDCYDACCGGGKPGDACYQVPSFGIF